MRSSQYLLLTLSMVMFIVSITCTDREELLKQSPDKWPGHLEPFGSKQRTVEVPSINEWPEPIEFFQNYVEKNVPVVFKGLAKRSPAYELFTDEFLKSFEGADTTMVSSETRKKEDRKQNGLNISFKEFIERYHNESLYLVDSLPKQLRKYVLMPAPLRCKETEELMNSQVTWFSSGGTKSVVHNDDVDNINCLYRGRKELLFIEYNNNKKFVPIDRPEGGYSSIDVDSVNYTKYPQLRHVDKYHHVTMEEGDCLFIPYHWFHQVNSVANDNGQNLAINIWFAHVFNHRPVKCDLAAEQATLDKFSFAEEEEEKQSPSSKESDDESEKQITMFETFLQFIGKLEKKEVKLDAFIKVLSRMPFVNPTKFKVKEFPEEYVASAKKIFETLDLNKDEILNNADVEEYKKMFQESNGEEEEVFEKIEDMDEILNREVAVIEDLFEDFVEKANQEMIRGEKEDDDSHKNKEKVEL